MLTQKIMAELTWDEVDEIFWLHLLNGDKVLYSTTLPKEITPETLEPTRETLVNMAKREEQEQGVIDGVKVFEV
jgi:hypothetical protein